MQKHNPTPNPNPPTPLPLPHSRHNKEHPPLPLSPTSIIKAPVHLPHIQNSIISRSQKLCMYNR